MPAEEVVVAADNAPPTADLDRLREIGNDDLAQMRRLAELYLTQADAICAGLAESIKANSTKQTRLLAHRWKGASVTCGMMRLAATLGQLEAQAEQHQLTDAGKLLTDACEELENVRRWVAENVTEPRNSTNGGSKCPESLLSKAISL